MLRLMLRIMIMRIVPEALCASIPACTILVGQLNKIFGLITQTITILHGLYEKIYDFGAALSPSLHHIFMEKAKKYPAYLIISRVGSTCRKHEKSPSI